MLILLLIDWFSVLFIEKRMVFVLFEGEVICVLIGLFFLIIVCMVWNGVKWFVSFLLEVSVLKVFCFFLFCVLNLVSVIIE